jgi:hypothetical protein
MISDGFLAQPSSVLLAFEDVRKKSTCHMLQEISSAKLQTAYE